MMILEVCHASFAFKMDDATKSMEDLALTTFPGENVSKFSNEAQRLIKIMKGGYALPYQLGSKLINKVCATQSLYFNRTMYNLLDHALAMEKRHGPHRDPKLLENDPEYPKYGPLGICVTMRENYSELVTTDQWPALKQSVPAGNLGAVPEQPSAVIEPKKNHNGMKCHICGSEYHFKAQCTTLKPPFTINDKGKGGGNGNPSGKGGASWRYVHPADDNATVTLDNKKYYFCKHCVCKHTGNKGFYNRTHASKDHTFPAGDTEADTSSTGTPTPGCSLGAASLVKYPSKLNAPPLSSPPPPSPTESNEAAP